MKSITSFLALLMLAACTNGLAQTTYAVNSNSGFSANCTNCTFNIAAGVTLTINHAGTCNNCVFNGGNIDVQHSLNCQPCTFNGNKITMTDQAINPNGNTTNFSNVNLTLNGNSQITATSPVAITNSTFLFNDNSFFNNNGGQLDISNSTLNFFGNSYFNANAGPVNLKNASKLVAGNGLLSSQAYIKMNGAVLNIVDNASSIVLANYNNYYFNWNSFSSLSNGKTYTTTYPSAASTMNCGKAGQNACGLWSTPNVYGPSALTAAGAMTLSSLLPVVLTNFATSVTASQVSLSWTTSQEIDAAYFSVERSSNGTEWKRIAVVTAQGSTAIDTRYTYIDAAPLNSMAWYRLAMVDVDGKVEYSAVKTVQSAVIKQIRFYPNPAIDNIHISLTGNTSEITVQLTNQSGQILEVRKIPANTALISLRVQQYPRGTYLISIASPDGTVQTTKIIIGH